MRKRQIFKFSMRRTVQAEARTYETNHEAGKSFECVKDLNSICMAKGHRRKVQDMLRGAGWGQIIKGLSPIIKR